MQAARRGHRTSGRLLAPCSVDDAEGIAGAGFGPGDAYRALWEQVGILREELAAEERKRSSDQSRRDTLRDQLARISYDRAEDEAAPA
jgi:hypothetical protein